MDTTTLPHQRGQYSPNWKEEGRFPDLFPKICNALCHLIGVAIPLLASMTPYLKTGTLVQRMELPGPHLTISTILHHQACVGPHQMCVDPHQMCVDPHQMYVDPHQICVDPHQICVDPHQMCVDLQICVDPHQTFIDPYQMCVDLH